MREPMTADQLLDWIRDNTGNHAEDSQLSAALWFVAVYEAEACLETFSLKDWARMFADGTQIGPFQSREDLDRWCEENAETAAIAEDEEDGDYYSLAYFEPKLRVHFGI